MRHKSGKIRQRIHFTQFFADKTNDQAVFKIHQSGESMLIHGLP